jgi:hypothetical protein
LSSLKSYKIKTSLLNDIKEKTNSDIIAYEICTVGWRLENLRLNIFFESKDGILSFNAHENCIKWSNGIILNECSILSNVEKSACDSLLKVFNFIKSSLR